MLISVELIHFPVSLSKYLDFLSYMLVNVESIIPMYRQKLLFTLNSSEQCTLQNIIIFSVYNFP